MTPGARVQAAIDLLGRTAAFAQPAERTVNEYLRGRRYIGSKDRRAITDRVFAVLRALARLDWWWARAGGADPEAATEAAERGGIPRGRVLAALALVERTPPSDIAAMCDGGRYAPEPLDPDEHGRLAALAGQPLTHAEQPEWVRGECPEWLRPGFRTMLGDDAPAALAGLTEPAPVDLRVNTLRADSRDEAAAALAEAGIQAAPIPHTPLGLRVTGRRAVTATPPFRDGRVEIQDAGAQIAAALADARPGMAVCDLCAGAGGKTLALAAAMRDTGRLVALDRDHDRLASAEPRLRRAGVHGVERRLLAAPDDPWLADNRQRFDRVVVDAPCSGTGTWRRHPDQRWRLTEAALNARIAEQRETLAHAAKLVKPGGRIAFITCSLLPVETTERVAELRRAHPELAPVPMGEAWAGAIGGMPPGPAEAESLVLTPNRHATDGFFVAILARSGDGA